MKRIFLLLATLTALAASQETANALEIIDTRFAETHAESATAAVPGSPEVLPLKAPTEIKVQPGETTLASGTESLNGWTSPYLLIQTGGLTAKPEFPAWASLSWNLEKLKLSSGVYQLAWKIMPLGGKFHGASATVALASSEGRPITPKLPPEKMPLRVSFTDKGMVRAVDRSDGGELIPYEVDSPCEFVITFDLDAKTWSASANGAFLVENLAFPEQLTASFPALMIQSITISGSGVPGTGIALSDVRFTRNNHRK